jgi:nitrous oxidase accessory protein NosD
LTPHRHSRFSVRVAASLIVAACLFPLVTQAVTLQSVYLSAPSQAGYDRYLELESGMTYTGGIDVSSGMTVCIKGNGATIDLQGSMIQVADYTTRLDIDHCVLVHGGNPDYGTGQAALNFVASSGNVSNNTIYGNTLGIRVYLSPLNAVRIKNNIVVKNLFAGVLCALASEPEVTYNDCWGNSGYGNYAIDCG